MFRSLHVPALALAAVLGIAARAMADPAPGQAPLTSDEARTIIAALAEAPEQGLPRRLSEASLAGLASPDLVVQAGAQASLAGEALDYAATLRRGRTNPRAIDRDWALGPDPFDAAAEFEAARAGGRLAQWLAGLAPDDARYRALLAARGRYAVAAANGGWAPLADGAPPRPGAVDPRIEALRARLAAEGYAAPVPPAQATASPAAAPDPAQVFDAPLQAALTAYQTRQGLKAEGALDKPTLAALNVTAAQRLAAIDDTLERWRWGPHALPADRIEVDIAAAELTLYEAGAPALSMRVIVGDPTHHTPSFAARAQAVVFNPPWIVPDSIARKELFPKIARDPTYMAREEFTLVGGQLVQAPGPKASLGYVKIDLDDPYSIYLHDTPVRTLFAKERRTLSHGCIRLQLPRDLAARLLAGQGWTRGDIDTAIDAKATRRVGLKTPVRVFVLYRTAVAAADGRVSFRPDVYGWDAELTAALATH